MRTVLISILQAAVLVSISTSARIDEKVLDDLIINGKTTVLLHFKGPTTSDVLKRYRPKPGSKNDELSGLLRANSEKQQAKTLRFLASRKVKPGSKMDYSQLWMLNQIIVKSLDLNLLMRLNRSDEISRIEADTEYRFLNPAAAPPVNDKAVAAVPPRNQWGVEDVGAPTMWSQGYSGEGITIGIMDSGIRTTHRSLASRLRSNFGWFDAVNARATPYDDHGHGTHCAGTAVGTRGIGVAPNATVISCKFINSTGYGSVSGARLCGQFLFCPTDAAGNKPSCKRRPQIVSNSWATRGGSFFNDVIDVWVAAGMISVFAVGNEGPWCDTIEYPARYAKSIAVGAVNIQNQVSWFSGRGPVTKRVNPDVVAPGQDVFSASHSDDTKLVVMSGTDMAAPHTAGVLALLCSQKPLANQEDARKILQKYAVKVVPSNETCNTVSDKVYPNNVAGYGKIVLK